MTGIAHETMKKTLLALAMAGAFSAALAQGLVTASPSKPAPPTVTLTTAGLPGAKVVDVTQGHEVGAPAGAAAKPSPLVNPFNGKPLTAEQIQRQLEETKLQTQLLEEQLKQVNLSEEIKSVPLRKAVEAAQAATSVKKEELALKEMSAPKVSPTAQAARPKTNTVKKTVTKRAKTKAEVPEAKAAPAQMPMPTLSSIVSIGAKRSIVLEAAGGTLVVGDGENSPFGQVQVLDGATARVGAMTLKVHAATMARFVNSDQLMATDTTNGGTYPSTAPVTAPTQPVATASAPSTSGAKAGALPPLPVPPANIAATLTTAPPSLQLPPGVSMLPSSTQ